MRFDSSKIFDLSKFFALPDTMHKSKKKNTVLQKKTFFKLLTVKSMYM